MKQYLYHIGNRLVLSTVGALSIPVSGTIALDNVTLSTSDGDIVARDDNGVEIIVVSISESL